MNLFGTKKGLREPAPDAPQGDETKRLLQPESAGSLLATPRRTLLLQHIWQRTALSRAQFAKLYRAPIERYAALVQHFPASEAHHHAYAGGMLDHGLEIVAFGLKLRQSHLLPVGAAPEVQAAQAEAWTAGTAYAALLHDVGKIAVDLHVEHADGSTWHPWHGPLARPYRFRFRADRIHRFHESAAGLMYAYILGQLTLDWLSGFPELWASLLYVLAGQYEHAGILGELVMQADRASVAQALGGDPAKVRDRRSPSIQRKLLEGLRLLVRERFKLNQPQASDGWLTEDALWLVSKTASDKLRAHLLSHGIAGVPEKNTVLFDVLQEHGFVQATPEGKAIWTACVFGENGWTQEFTFLRFSPALFWESRDRPSPFRGTVQVNAPEQTHDLDQAAPARSPTRPLPSERPMQADEGIDDSIASARTTLDTADSPSPPVPDSRFSNDPPRLPTVTETANIAPPTLEAPQTESTEQPAQAHGERFLNWLQQSVRSHRLIINDAKALIHTVDGTAFLVTPGIFQRFTHEHPVIRLESHEPGSGWSALQKSFERLGKHRKQPGGLNIWTCRVSGPRKSARLHGYLLLNGLDIFAEVPPDNPYLTLLQAKNENNEAYR
jgi:integrating conjugative element relaxase (TIGR03760 family)